MISRNKTANALFFLPLPVLRERAGVRVISSGDSFGSRRYPHPNPLPEYRERGPEYWERGPEYWRRGPEYWERGPDFAQHYRSLPDFIRHMIPIIINPVFQ